MKRIYPGKKSSKRHFSPEVKNTEVEVVPISVATEIISTTPVEKDEVDIVLEHIGPINKPDGIDIDPQTAGIETEVPYEFDGENIPDTTFKKI